MKKLLAVVVGIAIVGAAGVAMSQYANVKAFSPIKTFDVTKNATIYYVPADWNISYDRTNGMYWVSDCKWYVDGMWYYGNIGFTNTDSFVKWTDYFENATNWKKFADIRYITWTWAADTKAGAADFKFSNDAYKFSPFSGKIADGVWKVVF